MPPNRFESEVESFLEGSHGDRTHIKRADHHTVTPLCGTLLFCLGSVAEGGLLGEFRTGEIARKACGESFAVEVLLKALTVSVCMCGRSPCGGRSSPGDQFRMQFPSRHFKF